MSPSGMWLVQTTVGTREQALSLARLMVQGRLAACVQIQAVQSVYRWRGSVAEESEFQLSLKVRADRYRAVEVALLAHHPYEQPTIHALQPAAVDAPTLDWVRSEASAADP